MDTLFPVATPIIFPIVTLTGAARCHAAEWKGPYSGHQLGPTPAAEKTQLEERHEVLAHGLAVGKRNK